MGKMRLSMSLKGGRPITGQAMLDVFGPSLRLAGFAVQAGIQKESPVKTGTLRRSWTTGEPEKKGRGMVVYVGTAIVYAHYQNTRTRNRGHIERGVTNATPKAMQVFSDGVGAVINELWGGK